MWLKTQANTHSFCLVTLSDRSFGYVPKPLIFLWVCFGLHSSRFGFDRGDVHGFKLIEPSFFSNTIRYLIYQPFVFFAIVKFSYYQRFMLCILCVCVPVLLSLIWICLVEGGSVKKNSWCSQSICFRYHIFCLLYVCGGFFWVNQLLYLMRLYMLCNIKMDPHLRLQMEEILWCTIQT